ncbi:MAG TPA: sigma 54 modulation/S30EA ribosomal C-terminal domain-containing protein [Thermoanaerobaculia bacterium]|nr:sigma 54 modulation/S30EA ribosomal C-terminal domain-containing protein [Thermoanaerobaculia bacterium]
MPTPMSAYSDIAARYQVDPADEEAVTKFFRETAPTLPAEERKQIFNELLAAQENDEKSGTRQRYTVGTPDVRPREVKLAAVPARAFNPHRDGDELHAISRSITRWIDHYFRLLGMAITTSVTTSESGKLLVYFAGSEAAQLASKQQRHLLDSMRSLLSQVAQVQPVIDLIEIGVQAGETPAAASLGEGDFVPGNDETPHVVSMDHIPIKEMSVQDAARTLEESRDEFIVFRDAVSDKIRVIYKRSDRNLGLISPE